MAIKRRDIKAERSKKRGRLRHPLLKIGSVYLRLYNYIKDNPHCYFRDTHHISEHPMPLSMLVQEGLIRAHGKIPRTYTAVKENETGGKRDKVLVRIAVFANKYGEFSATCELVGQKLTATDDFPQQVAYREVLVSVPAPDDPYAIRPMIDINERVASDSLHVYTPDGGDDLTIDVDFEIIPPTK